LFGAADVAGVGADVAVFVKLPSGGRQFVKLQLHPAVAGGGLVDGDLEAGVGGVGTGTGAVAYGIAIWVNGIGGIAGGAGGRYLHPDFIGAGRRHGPCGGFCAAAYQFNLLCAADFWIDFGAGWRCRHCGGQVENNRQQGGGDTGDGMFHGVLYGVMGNG